MRTTGTKKLKPVVFTASVIVLMLSMICRADTFTHRKTGRILHGYAIGQVENNTTAVTTQQEGVVRLNLAEWKVTSNRHGRNNKVIVVTLDCEIMLKLTAEALRQGIIESSYEGPLFILLEIDTPGGDIGLAKRICSTITGTTNCPVIAFVKGGQHGGAVSAGAAVALACDKIYMKPNTVIGSAALIAGRGTRNSGGSRELKRVYGRTLSEKLNSAWKAYLASLAEQNDRPAILARAMIDEDIEAVEVTQAKNRLFIEPAHKKPSQKIVRTWSKKGSLLTLTATEAVQSGIADKIVESREQLLVDLGATDAEIVTNTAAKDAAREFRAVTLKYNKLMKSLDLKQKEIPGSKPRPRILKILRELKSDYQVLIKLAKRYPDLGVSVQRLEENLNYVEAAYQNIKRGGDTATLKWKDR